MDGEEASDADLLHTIAVSTGRARDDAFATLYARYKGPLRRVALQHLHDPDQADDATQVTMVKVWNSASTFQPHRKSAAGWVLTILRNTCIDMLRQGGPAESLSDDQVQRRVDDDEVEAFQPGPGPKYYVYRCAMEHLTAEERAFILSYLDRGSGRPSNTAKAALARFKEMVDTCHQKLYGAPYPWENRDAE